MKRRSWMATVAMLLALLGCFGGGAVAWAGEIVEPSTANILVNGVARTFEVYNIGENNYFKLRDLALALQGTPKGFDVRWDQQKNAIVLEKNKPYTGAGSGEAVGKGRVKIAEYSHAAIFIDGRQVTLGAVAIEQNHYFKLRDIMRELDVGVTWDGQTQTVAINTAQGYIVPDALPLAGRLICVDPGHGTFAKAIQEPVAPNSTQTKSGFVSGTAGAQYSEAEVNLAVGLMLKEKLEAQGAQVLMTREGSEATLSNVGRAKLANEAKADLVIRLHCDGSASRDSAGMSLLVPSSHYMEAELAQVSADLGAVVLDSTVKATGATSRGIVVRADLAGFNWSTVPTILLEMGFMSNPAEDKKLSTGAYQNQLATGMTTGVVTYFQDKIASAPKISLPKSHSPMAIRVERYMATQAGMSQVEALWQVKMDLDQPEFTQAKVLTAEQLASTSVIVNKRYCVPENYAPADLVPLTGRVSLRAETKMAFDQMVADAKSQGYRITPVSGYRSVDYQRNLYNRYLKTDSVVKVDTYSARAGFSEHHTGMAVDVAGANNSMSNFGASQESPWVMENAYKYGFIVRYLPEAQGITGYKSEPWHLRYVGTDIAGQMKAQGIQTLEEYVGRFLV